MAKYQHDYMSVQMRRRKCKHCKESFMTHRPVSRVCDECKKQRAKEIFRLKGRKTLERTAMKLRCV